MRTTVAAVLVAASGLATSGPARANPIIGGAVDSGDPAVVMLAAYPADHSTLFTCTAIVVSPTALITAAHCLDHPGFAYGVFFGADASAFPTLAALEPQLAAVAAVHPHPQYEVASPFFADIGVVELAQPTTVTPLAFTRTAPTAAMVGASVRIVGYGQTTFGTNNSTKFAATTTITSLDTNPADTILIGNAQARTCVGDSGGPALLGGVVIGIDSYSDTTGCTDPAHFRRTDAYASFIDQFAGTSPDDPPPGDPPPSDPGDPGTDDGGGGCSSSGGSLGGMLIVLGALLAKLRR